MYSGFLNRLVETNHYCIRAELLICCKKRTLVAQRKLFLEGTEPYLLKKTEISKSAYFALSSLLVVAKSTLNFSLHGHTTLAVFEQVFYHVDLRNKLPLNTNQLTCGRLLHVSFFVLASFIASDLTKKLPFMKFETKLLASSLLC